MPKANEVPTAFPGLRGAWAQAGEIPAALAAVDDALARRAGSRGCPSTATTEGKSRLVAVAVAAARNWLDGHPPEKAADRTVIARQIRVALQEKFNAAVWPRWLLLEQALLDASESGDLLFAAAVLRTMCEEAMSLGALDVSPDEASRLAASDAPADVGRLEAFLRSAWCMFADLPPDAVLESFGWPSGRAVAALLPRLERAKASLNAYVHPNYGSHVATLDATSSVAGCLVLEATLAAYEAFFALSWSALAPPLGSLSPPNLAPPVPWAETLSRLQTEVLPHARKAAHPMVRIALEVPNLARWLGRVSSPAAGGLVGVSQAESADRGGHSDVPPARERMWEGADAEDLRGLDAARHAEARLAAEFPGGAPERSEEVRWLRFNTLSLELAVLLARVRSGSMRKQLVRQISRGNAIGIWLCIRSLIEQQAQAIGLPVSVLARLDGAAPEVAAWRALPAGMGEVEQAVTNALAAQSMRSAESRRPWTSNEDGTARRAWSRPGAVLESALSKDDRFRTLFAMGSSAMHGRFCRGRDLTRDGAGLTGRARNLGLLTLDRLSHLDEDMKGVSAATVALSRLRHASGIGGARSAADDSMARHVYGDRGQPLRPGVDYVGGGTRDDPFAFKPHLEFHYATAALLAQLGTDSSTALRVLDGIEAGHLVDRWSDGRREIFIKRPLPGI